MTNRYRKFEIQLQDLSLGPSVEGPSILTSGGKCIVTAAGSQAKATLYADGQGTAQANPVSGSAGKFIFYTLDTIETVDLFILTGSGYSAQLYGVSADGVQLVPINRHNRHQMLIIPISVANQVSDNTEVDTGIDLIAGMVMLPWPYIKVVTIDATETVDVGTGEAVPADGGDSDGYISAASVGTAGLVSDVNGALIASIVTQIAEPDSLTWKMSAGSDTATLYVFLPYMLMTTGVPGI